MDARLIHIRGIVQGVGFRPFVYRLAHAHGLCGWVANQQDGVHIHIEGQPAALQSFAREVTAQAPSVAQISAIETAETRFAGHTDFVIRESERSVPPSVRISPDLPICAACLDELFDPANPRYLYPYINCTNCGPRFSVIEGLPYDRGRTTMRHWPMDDLCAAQYENPSNRRFHAQPVACPRCGPHYAFESGECCVRGDQAGIEAAVALLHAGGIVGIKGIGGYHLSCDAHNSTAVRALREKKFRKEKPFAVMARDLDIARRFVDLSASAQELLFSLARPIVLAPARIELPDIAPGNHELGIMLPYAPIHHLLFAAGAPEILVMTSANRSSEPIAYRDEHARQSLHGLAHGLLTGDRPIARRIDDSVARAGVFGSTILRRSRGYAPAAVATLPCSNPILALGSDLKNTVTLVVDGQAFVSQHIGDLDQYESFAAFQETVRDFLDMYAVNSGELTLVHDTHPGYASTQHAKELTAARRYAVQHHQAHIASVLAEMRAWNRRVIGVAFDGTGYGDDGSIWGGEFFAGSMSEGWKRPLHLRTASLPGGDAAARFPVQSAAGFLSQLDSLPNLLAPPFRFPKRYLSARQLVARQVRSFTTSSMGRLFDTVAALLGFTRETTFEGQAAMWLEQLARTGEAHGPYPFPIQNDTLDFRPLLAATIEDRVHGKEPAEIARRFHLTIAATVYAAICELSDTHSCNAAVFSGGVFQNELLLQSIFDVARHSRIEVFINHAVPPNDGGISLGQAACAAILSNTAL